MTSYTEVFAWGGDHFGQLGQGTQNTGKTYSVPRLCSFNVVIRELACGDEHTAFVDSHGYVYTMGSNSEGRLGVSDRAMKQSSAPCLVEGIAKVVTLSCGWGHTAAITEDGAMFTWGIGEYGALGLGNADTRWQPARVPMDVRFRAVSCGSRHTGAIASDAFSSRSLYTFGSGEAGQLGTGRRDRELTPVRLSITEEVKQASCGVFQTGFITQSGKLFMTGGNSFGQLGTGTRKSANTPQRVGFFAGIAVARVACGQHTAAVTEDGELYLWGTGAFGEFTTPQRMSMGISVKDISVGGGFGTVIDSSNRLWAWGSNANGELGLGDYEARAVPTVLTSLANKRVRIASCGGCYAMALGSDVEQRGRSPNSSRNYGKSPQPKTSRSPLNHSRSPITSERSNQNPFSRALDLSRTEEDSRTYEYQKSEDRRRLEAMTARQETMSLARMRELEEMLKRKEIELADSKAKNDRLRLDSDESMRARDSELQSVLRQGQSLSAENQRLLRSLEAKDEELALIKSANASLLDANEKMGRECISLQKSVEELQRRTEAKQDSLLQSSRMRDDFQQQLQSLQSQLDQEFVLRKQLTQDYELTTAHRRRLEESLNSFQQRVERLEEDKKDAEERAERAEQQGKVAAADNQHSSVRLESELQSAQSQLRSLLQELDQERALTDSLQAELSHIQQSYAHQSMLENAVSDLKYEVEEIHRKHNDCMLEMDGLRGKLQEAEGRNSQLKAENADLREALAAADAKNRELFTNFERELTSRAREYRERTMNVLGSPGSGAKTGTPITPPRSDKNPPRSDRYRRESPGLNTSVVSDRSPAKGSAYRQSNDPQVSPERKIQSPGRHSPPTFREGSAVPFTQLNVKSSITEIRDKLASLQQNKSALEAKMRDFERKIRVDGESRD